MENRTAARVQPEVSQRSARGQPELSEDRFFLVEFYSDLVMLEPRSQHVRLLPLSKIQLSL